MSGAGTRMMVENIFSDVTHKLDRSPCLHLLHRETINSPGVHHLSFLPSAIITDIAIKILWPKTAKRSRVLLCFWFDFDYLTFQANKHFCFDLEASQHEPKHTSMAASKSRIFYNRMAVDVLYLTNDYMDNSTSYYRELFYMYYLS